MATLVGCSFGVQGTQSDSTGYSTGIAVNATTTPFPCPPEQSFAPKASGESDMAPAYEEIRRTVQCIVKSKRSIPQQSKDLYEYQQSLVGKKVVGWQGWVLGVTPARADIEAVRKSRDPDFDPDPTIWIAVYDPTGKPLSERLTSSVMLHGASWDQAGLLRAWADPLTTEDAWQQIQFDGEILSVDSYDYVNILVADLKTESGP